MNEFEYNKFIKRYDKFKNNNLPTPFYDEERQTFEYVYFDKEKLMVNSNIINAFDEIISGLYYPFSCKYLAICKENDEIKEKMIDGHMHAHLFEEVVSALYEHPESFKISKDEEIYYNNQELKYLKRLQKYLLFIGMKDIKTTDRQQNRYCNKLQKKYANVIIQKFDNNLIEDIINKKINYRVIECPKNYQVQKKLSRKVLITNEDYDFKLFIEYIKEEMKEDKLILYFKVLESYN